MFQKAFRVAFEQMGIITDVVHHLHNDNMKLKENCALAIFKCSVNETTRHLVREAGGLDPLCKLIQTEQVRANKKLLAAVTGGIWKCAMSQENIIRFNQNGLVASLVPLLEENEDEDVLTNVVGALAECCKHPSNRDVLRTNEGLPKLVKLIKYRDFTHFPLFLSFPFIENSSFSPCFEKLPLSPSPFPFFLFSPFPFPLSPLFHVF